MVEHQTVVLGHGALPTCLAGGWALVSKLSDSPQVSSGCLQECNEAFVVPHPLAPAWG